MIPRRPLQTAALAACLSLAALTPANTVFAQSSFQVTSQASAQEVEVGEPFTVELRIATTQSPALSDAELRAPAGFSVSGPMVGRQSFFSWNNGAQSSQLIVTATWTLVASSAGTFNIPAPTAVWSNQTVRGSPTTIRVVPQGSRPPKQQGGFLFPGGLPPGLNLPGFPFGVPDDDSDQPGEEPSLALPRAPNDDVFLHAIVDKTTAVVGEQVTLSLYVYYRPTAVSKVRDSSAMPMQDFLRYSLIKDQGVQTSQIARAGNRQFKVRLVEKYALFPLRTGKLQTGRQIETYLGSDGRRVMKRQSEDLAITVTEPPIANRPVGFRQGDVGQFALSALVQPRRVEEGGSVAVTVKVTGTGNFPTSLKVPERTGLEWLDPEKKENIEARNDEISGFRSFGYVVRLTKKGTVDLGNIELPYWNPRNKRYEIAKSALGTVEVTPSATAPSAPAASANAPDDPFKDTPPPRTTLSPFTPKDEPAVWLQGYRFGAAIVAPPFLAIAGIAGFEGLRRLRSGLQRRRTSHRTLAASALEDARKAPSPKEAAAAIERAVVLAIEGATGLKARGVLKDSLVPELTAKGIPERVALRAKDTLAACDHARFDPLAAAEVKLEEAESLVADLLRGSPS